LKIRPVRPEGDLLLGIADLKAFVATLDPVKQYLLVATEL